MTTQKQKSNLIRPSDYTWQEINDNDGKTFPAVMEKLEEQPVEMVVADTAYKTPAIAKLLHDKGIRLLSTYKRPQTKNPDYFHYLLYAYDVAKVLYNMGNGVRQSLNYGELSKLHLIEPLLSEQHLIASFLDSKCAEIDALTADIQTQVDTLEQYKRSIITEAVTKGLNPNVEMKDSRIEWIDRLPAQWTVIPAKYLFYNSDTRKLAGDEQLTASQKARLPSARERNNHMGGGPYLPAGPGPAGDGAE